MSGGRADWHKRRSRKSVVNRIGQLGLVVLVGLLAWGVGAVLLDAVTLDAIERLANELLDGDLRALAKGVTDVDVLDF